jgi:hypothetical protein
MIAHVMIKHLTKAVELEDGRRRIVELIDAHGEWFYASGAGDIPIALRKGEIDLRVSHGRLILSCWDNRGALEVWRVVGWEEAGEKLLLEATRRMGAVRAVLELVPRASVSAIAEGVSAARRKRCERLAHLACAQAPGAKVERAALSPGAQRGHPGRYARILLRLPAERIAVTGAVAENERHETDALLSSALVWFRRTSESMRAPYLRKLWLVVHKEETEAARKSLALLCDDLRRAITLYERDDAWQELTPVPQLERAELWTNYPARFRSPRETATSEMAARIIALAPDAIDVAHARHGETLRFHGLPFARLRLVMNNTSVWFGVEGSRRRLLNESNHEDWLKLLQDLKEHRLAVADDRHHALYKASPEAWLESMLRRDITQLDAGLIISPLHAQFRTLHEQGASTRPIDLLALRRDGRLVVIELKVSEDREHVLQGADYWRRVEAHRRRGFITRARLFGDATILDEPPLVYLVAPMLRFHRSFPVLARAIAPDIEIYRFEINADWRAGVRVVRRETYHD